MQKQRSNNSQYEVIAFDYGRTLFDRENNEFFPDAYDTVLKLGQKYRLAIVSYSKENEIEERIRLLKKSGLYDKFFSIAFSDTPEGKKDEYEKLLNKGCIKASQLVIIDDHIIRGISWGNRNSVTTIWFRNGKFSNVTPNQETGIPTFTISCLSEVLNYI